MKIKRLLLLMAALLALSLFPNSYAVGCGPSESDTKRQSAPGTRLISRSDLGSQWPLTVTSGVLRCQIIKLPSLRTEAVTFKSNGVVYNVNGMATTHKVGVEIEPIWAQGAGAPRKSISALIRAGLDLCKQLP